MSLNRTKSLISSCVALSIPRDTWALTLDFVKQIKSDLVNCKRVLPRLDALLDPIREC
jgi:hypothetical protein